MGNARRALAHAEKLATLNADERRQLADAEKLNRQALQLYEKGNHRATIPLLQQVLEIRKKVLGRHSRMKVTVSWKSLTRGSSSPRVAPVVFKGDHG